MRFKLAGILNTEELFNFNFQGRRGPFPMKTTCRFFQYRNLSLSLSLSLYIYIYIYNFYLFIPTFITEKVKRNEAFFMAAYETKGRPKI
jgi:hypothetical protein